MTDTVSFNKSPKINRIKTYTLTLEMEAVGKFSLIQNSKDMKIK